MPNGNQYHQKEIISLVAAGDGAAFKQLFDLYRNRIYSVGLKLTRSAVLAEEVVQDVFLNIWTRRETLTGVKDFESYLFIVTRNEVYLMLRRIARRKAVAADAGNQLDLADNDTDNLVLNRDYTALVQEAVEKLPPQQKLVYTLIKVEGLKREEVADQLNLSPDTVKTHLAQAMRSIRAFCRRHIDLYLLLAYIGFRN